MTNLEELKAKIESQERIINLYKDSDFYMDGGGKIIELFKVIKDLETSLKQIAGLGGNLPDERLTDRTGPNDAARRGILYCSARAIAQEAIVKAEAVLDAKIANHYL